MVDILLQMFAAKRFVSSLSHPSKIGLAFDIDGVLIRGKKVLPTAKYALTKLIQLQVPFILLTNGGGMSEEQKAIDLSLKLGVSIDKNQIVLSHSPMRRLVSRYQDLPVLIVGNERCKAVAHSYGFKKLIDTNDVFLMNPSVWPFRRPVPHEPAKSQFNESISAIMMFSDSWNWGQDLQIMCDVLRSENGMLGTLAKNPISQSNSDFLWSNDYPVNRFAQGAFRLSLETLYQKLAGHQLKYTKFGKPELETYRYASKVISSLKQIMWPMEDGEHHKIYMVGDNPDSDIIGANQHGWESVLVKTGVWKESDGHGHGAKHLVDDVGKAVELVLREEGLLY